MKQYDKIIIGAGLYGLFLLQWAGCVTVCGRLGREL